MNTSTESFKKLIEDVFQKLATTRDLDESKEQDAVGTMKKIANDACADIDEWEKGNSSMYAKEAEKKPVQKPAEAPAGAAVEAPAK